MQSERPDTLIVELSREPMAPALARRAIGSFLDARCPPKVVQTALMVGSELVTNAIRHTSGGCQLSVRLGEGEIVIEVRDNDTQLTDRKHLDGDLIGRGLGMVQLITRRWGIEKDLEGGKVVWAEIDLGC